jgi:hypothetical protein
MRINRLRRREFITLLAVAFGSPLVARAQSLKRPLIAWLSGGSYAASSGFVDAFLRGMRDLGYVEGRNFDIVYRYADGYAERLPTLASRRAGSTQTERHPGRCHRSSCRSKEGNRHDPDCNTGTRRRGASEFDS